MPGGRIAPDGRPPQAKGVGKTAKRHDLEKPKTPGIGGPATGKTDLQQGDVQMLEQGQQVQPPAGPRTQRTGRGGAERSGQPKAPAAPPDAIEYLGGRLAKGELPRGQAEDPSIKAWIPLFKELMRKPNRSGPLAVALMQQVANYAEQPRRAAVSVIDENQIQAALKQQ